VACPATPSRASRSCSPVAVSREIWMLAQTYADVS
jgi:hypothetical protein